MGPRKWTPKWGPETGPQNGVLKVDPKMGPLSWKCFDFFLISTTGPLAGCISWTPFWAQFLDPYFWGPLSGTPFRSPQWIQKTKKMFCVANIFGSKEAENHIYRADLMVTLKRMDEYNARMFEVLNQNFNAASNASVVDVARKKQNPRQSGILMLFGHHPHDAALKFSMQHLHTRVHCSDPICSRSSSNRH